MLNCDKVSSVGFFIVIVKSTPFKTLRNLCYTLLPGSTSILPDYDHINTIFNLNIAALKSDFRKCNQLINF